MATGNVKWFDNRKGWGFITQSDGEEVFAYITDGRRRKRGR